jgi:hypothetical protein
MRNTSFLPISVSLYRDRSFRSTPKIGHDLVKQPVTIDRNHRSRLSEMTGHDAPKYALEVMLAGLNAPAGAMVIMDAGIATEANLLWLAEHGYRYLVVRRAGARQFDEAQAVTIETAGGEPIRLQKETSEDGKEVRLYCHSAGREAKETAMTARFAQGFEAGLQKIADGLLKPRAEKRHDKLLERIGRLKEKSRGAGRHYTVNLVTDEPGKTVTALTWLNAEVAGTMATHPTCIACAAMSWPGTRKSCGGLTPC